MQSMCFCSCCWCLETTKRETFIWVTLLLRVDLNVDQMPAFGVWVSGYCLSNFISQLCIVTYCVEFISCCWVQFGNTHFTLHFSAWFEVSLMLEDLQGCFLSPPKLFALCLLILRYLSWIIHAKQHPKLPGTLSTKLHNSMSKAGLWEISVRSCEESFL